MSGRNSKAAISIAGGIMALSLALMPGLLRAQDNSPWGGGDNPAAQQHDATFPHYKFRDDETLDNLRIHYATMGEPHRNQSGEIDNAVLVLHWTGSDSRAVLTPPYLNALYGSDRPLDFRKYFLIFPDSIGLGRSSKPSDGLRMNFPRYGYRDMVDLQHKLVAETLGIKHLRAILGMSMGGMNAWQWAEAYPDMMDGVMPVVSLPTRVSGRNLIWRLMAIGDVESDPDWNGGNYTRRPRGWTQAYQLLRLMIDGVPHMQAIAPDIAGAGKFIEDAAKQSTGAEPIDVLYSLKASADYDPEPALKTITTKVFALNFGDDEFNPDSLQILQTRISHVERGQYVVQPGSAQSFGHLTMAHPEQWAEHVATFMDQIER
jgi:homoserine O-acetyltransferase/O-succinyltransferase